MNHQDLSSSEFTSELGIELYNLSRTDQGKCLSSQTFKDILRLTEDIRVATRLSEIQETCTDSRSAQKHAENVKELRFNLESGQQQCIRDFFMCLRDNQLH